jgi:hypothetical protein
MLKLVAGSESEMQEVPQEMGGALMQLIGRETVVQWVTGEKVDVQLTKGGSVTQVGSMDVEEVQPGVSIMDRLTLYTPSC